MMLRLLSFFLLTGTACAAQEKYFAIRVVDEATGRGVPLVELRTVHNVRYYTDSAGYVAFHEPGLMNTRVFFHVSSHGYEFPEDGFGFRGTRLAVVPGGEATIRIRRVNIAERLYRVTGAGIYRDSHLLSRPVPAGQPLVNAKVLGSDSVVNTVYRGQVYWFWGDTNRASYPLGNFHVPGAISQLPERGGSDPDIGVALQYFTSDDGFASETARMPGKGPTWINGLITLKENASDERMFAMYVKIKPPLKVYERGLVEFDDDARRFRKVTEFKPDAPLFPHGHPFRHTSEGTEYVYFGNPFPVVRVPATADALQDLSRYEAYTCLTPGSRTGALTLDRDTDGQLRYAWKPDTIPFTPKLQAHLLSEKQIQPEEALYQLYSDAGKPVLIHGGSVSWNAYRKRWVMIAVESFGTSALGEVWFAEAVKLTGPWRNARKIVTHEKYSFYNPKQHPMFAKDNGREIYFEGTYTNLFSGNPEQTPRYNYNQIMYKLDLSDPRLSQ